MSRTMTIHAETIWTGGDAGVLRNGSLIIEDGRIAYVGPRIGGHADAIDLHGATLIPGLIDAHLHLSDDGAMPLQLLARGITTLRDTGNNHLALIRLRERQSRGEWIGPRIQTFGCLIDGKTPHWAHIARPVRTTDEATSLVDNLVSDGVDGLKTYVGMTPELVRRVVEAGARHGKAVTCHCGTCRASQALVAGVGCVEHVMSLDALDEEVRWGDFDPASDRWRALSDQFVQSGARFCPTLVVEDAVAYGWGPLFRASIGYGSIPRPLCDFLARTGGGATWKPDRVEQARSEMRGKARAVYELHRAGVTMMAGSDAPLVPPGDGLHTELIMLRHCGIPTHDVLRMATRTVAEYLGLDKDIGTLEVGKRADIVATRRDLLADITRIREIAAVWQGGERLDLAALEAAAARAVSRAEPCSDGIPPWGIPYGVDEEAAP